MRTIRAAGFVVLARAGGSPATAQRHEGAEMADTATIASSTAELLLAAYKRFKELDVEEKRQQEKPKQ